MSGRAPKLQANIDRMVLDVPQGPLTLIAGGGSMLWFGLVAALWNVVGPPFNTLLLFPVAAASYIPCHLYQRWVARRGAPLIRLGDAVEKRQGWLVDMPLSGALLVGLGSGLLVAAPVLLMAWVMTSSFGEHLPLVWLVAGCLALGEILGVHLTLLQRRIAGRTIAANRQRRANPLEATAPLQPVERPARIPTVPWRLYLWWAGGIGLSLVVGLGFVWAGMPPQALALFPILGWIGGLIGYRTTRPSQGSWVDFVRGKLSGAVAFGLLYFSAGMMAFLLPPVLTFVATQLIVAPWSAPPLTLVLASVGAITAISLVAGVWTPLQSWAGIAMAFWVPKTAKAR